MQLRNLLSDDRAVSPVIGVILMVAITVILAAVIGTFVLGLGDSVQQTSPSASFGFDYGDTPADNVTIAHEGGDSIDNSTLSVNVEGADEGTWPEADGTVSAGSSITLGSDAAADITSTQFDAGAWSGEEIRIVWTSNDGSSSQTVGSSTAPSN
ncbi:type IV pilin [Haloparvum alkalitolerans]|uniref:type IV pilin n=1 Tax=Haloparvum alkalitolerans TaxID=1042953 RepID=UPI003CF31300